MSAAWAGFPRDRLGPSPGRDSTVKLLVGVLLTLAPFVFIVGLCALLIRYWHRRDARRGVTRAHDTPRSMAIGAFAVLVYSGGAVACLLIVQATTTSSQHDGNVAGGAFELAFLAAAVMWRVVRRVRRRP
jgi:hypothetical protein